MKEYPLSPKQKKAIELAIYDGLKKKEIAQAVGVGVTTISKWFNSDTAFIEAYDEALFKADKERARKYKAAAQRVQDRLIELANCDDKRTALTACKEILDRAGDMPTDKHRIDMDKEQIKVIFVGEDNLED